MGTLTCSADHLHLLMQLLASQGLQLRDIGHNLPADALFNRLRPIPLLSFLDLLEQAAVARPQLALEFGMLLALQRPAAEQSLQHTLALPQSPFWQLFRTERTDDGENAEIRLHWQALPGWPAQFPAVIRDVLVAALHQHWLAVFQLQRESVRLSLPGDVDDEFYAPFVSCRIQPHAYTLAWRLPLHLLPQSAPAAEPGVRNLPVNEQLTLAKSTNLLLRNLSQPPGLEQLSERLGTSERTLKRRLQHAGCHYQQLLSDLRLQQAAWWLHQDGESVTAVAERLGYSSIANFSKAFRKWSGTTPTQVRRYGAQRASVDADA